MKTINELLDQYGQMMHDAGIIKGELLAKLHLAKEFADIPEHNIQVVIPPEILHSKPVNHVDLLAISPSERIEYDEKYHEHGTTAGMIMRTMKEFPTRAVDVSDIYAKTLQLYPDRTFAKSSIVQTIYKLTEANLLSKVGKGHYKQAEQI